MISSQGIKKIQKQTALKIFDLSNPLKICWKLENEESIDYSDASDNQDDLFVFSSGGKINSLTPESGEKRWETNLGGDVVSTPYIDGENVYIVSKPNQNRDEVANENEGNIIIRSLSISSGITVWQTSLKTKLNPEQVTLYIFESTLLIADSNGNCHSINKNDGNFNWLKILDVKLSAPPYFYADKAIFGTFGKQLIILTLGEGKIYEKIDLRAIPTAISYNIKNETLIVGDQKGVVSLIKIDFEISKKEKEKKNINWKFRLGAEVSNISFTPRGLLITSLDNFVYLISTEKGKLIWKKRLAGRISEKLLILDNYALLTTIADPTISVIELSTGRLINKIILENENFVTASPIKAQNNIIVTTSKGLYAFSADECL